MSCFVSLREFDAETAQAILAAVVEHLPTSGPLEYRLERTGEYTFTLHRVESPAVWMAQRAPSYEESSFLSDGNEDRCVAASVMLLPYPGASDEERTFRATIAFPELPEFWDRVPSLIKKLGTTTEALWAEYTSDSTAYDILNRVERTTFSPAGEQRPRAQGHAPMSPAWVSFWSYSACQGLGFTGDHAQRARFARTEELPGRGWLVQLTDEPLDLDRPEHLARLHGLCQALPTLGQAKYRALT